MSIKESVENCLFGVHLGDALGVPFENMTRSEVLAATNGTGCTGPAFDLPIKRKVPDTRGLLPGATSDDSQLANAVADALIQGDGYHHELMVLHHLFALWHDAAGWGGTTKRSLYEIDKWYRNTSAIFIKPPDFRGSSKNASLWEKAVPRDPRHPARFAPQSRGNGVAMKIAPLGAFLGARYGSRAFDSGEALERVWDLGRITHEDPISSIAAYAIASIVNDLVCGISAEYAYINVKNRIEDAEASLKLQHHGNDRFSDALQKALALSCEPEELWAFGCEGRSDALTSVSLAIGIWHRHCEDREPTAAVLEAINAGGDTDTVASMVGAMMGAGSEERHWWPKEWVRSLKDQGSLALSLGSELCDVARGNMLSPGWQREDLLRKIYT